MFSKACAIAAEYTFPVFVSYYFFDKTVESSLGSFVIINDEGWVITAAHILDSAMLGQKHAIEIQKHNEAVAYIETQEKNWCQRKKEKACQIKYKCKVDQ